MKTATITFAIILLSFVGFSQNNLTVKINGLKTSSGTVMIKLLDANEKVIQSQKVKVSGSECSTSFKNLKSGTYAVQYFHDQNNNGKLDTGAFGRPEEGYGYSNDARGFMGPADFEDQVFELKSDLTITLKTI